MRRNREKVGSCQKSNPGHMWLAASVLPLSSEITLFPAWRKNLSMIMLHTFSPAFPCAPVSPFCPLAPCVCVVCVMCVCVWCGGCGVWCVWCVMCVVYGVWCVMCVWCVCGVCVMCVHVCVWCVWCDVCVVCVCECIHGSSTWPYMENMQASHKTIHRQQVRHVQLTAPPGWPPGPAFPGPPGPPYKIMKMVV